MLTDAKRINPARRLFWAASGIMIWLLISSIKFAIMMVIMTIICTLAWDAFLNGKVYGCTDGGACDYWFVGDWVHAHDGLPIEVVPKIVPPHDMSGPDTIKQGWSVAGLWCVWILFFTTSVAVSILFAWVSWFKKLSRLADKYEAQGF